jgi:hypothetical protein
MIKKFLLENGSTIVWFDCFLELPARHRQIHAGAAADDDFAAADFGGGAGND